MKKLILFTSAVLCMGAIVMYGCKKKDIKDTDLGGDASIVDETQTAVDNNALDEAAKDAIGICGGARNDRGSTIRISSDSAHYLPCMTIQRIVSNGDSTIICSFPDTCTDTRGHASRFGVMVMSWSADQNYDDPGAIKTIKFVGYVFKGYKLSGAVSFVNATGTLTINSASGLILCDKKGDSTFVTSINYTRTKVSEGLTPSPFDDTYHFSGTSGGRTKKHDGKVHTFSVSISQSNPLIFDLGCKYILTGGVVNYSIGVDGATAHTTVIDFGTGACDHEARVTRDGTEVSGFTF